MQIAPKIGIAYDQNRMSKSSQNKISNNCSALSALTNRYFTWDCAVSVRGGTTLAHIMPNNNAVSLVNLIRKKNILSGTYNIMTRETLILWQGFKL